MPEFEVASMAANAAVASGVSAASAPPASAAVASPVEIMRVAEPMAWAPAAHAETTP